MAQGRTPVFPLWGALALIFILILLGIFFIPGRIGQNNLPDVTDSLRWKVDTALRNDTTLRDTTDRDTAADDSATHR